MCTGKLNKGENENKTIFNLKYKPSSPLTAKNDPFLCINSVSSFVLAFEVDGIGIISSAGD